MLCAGALAPGNAVRASAETALPLVSWGGAALIALCYYLSQSAWLAGLGFWTLYRPLVGGLLVGLILGDPLRGAQAGATINLAYLGFIATGGALPSDISLAGYLGATLVVAGGLEPNAALALTVPVGLLGYWIYQLRMTLDVIFAHWADGCAARGDARGVAWCNVWPPQMLLFFLSFIPCFIGVYYGPAWLAGILDKIPARLLSGLAVVGGMLPALGIALNLRLLWRGANGAYFILAFLLNALARVPLLTFGLLAAAWAIIQLRPPAAPAAEAATADALDRQNAAEAVPPRPCRLDGRTLWASWLNWLFFSHACYNYERMQGVGLAHALAPALRRLYPNKEELAQALQRHLTYYNAEPNLGAVINGVVLALEEACAQDRAVSQEAIQAIKVGLMGPVSGLGDTLIQGTLAPLLLSLGIGLVNEGHVWGGALYAVWIAALVWGIGALAFWRGYRGGHLYVTAWLQRGTLQRILGAAEIVGSSVLGALAALVVHVRTTVTFSVGQGVFRLQEDLLDKLLPQGLPLALILFYVWLLGRVPARWLVLGTCVLGIAAHLLGLL